MPDGFDPSQLNDAERIVLAAVARGRAARFGGGGPRAIRATFLRHLLLRLPVPGRAEGWPIALTGVRVEGALVEGVLDLADAAAPGAGLPTLALKDCDIPRRMNLASARIASLSVEGSRFQALFLREAEIDGPLDFSAARPFKPLGGIAWIDAAGAIINGRVTGNGARLRAPRPRAADLIEPGQRHAALRLVDAEIRGSIMLNNVHAEGGVSLDTAHVRGDVLMEGAAVTSGEDDALSAQNARIGGMMALRKGFTARGTVWLYGAAIDGCLSLSRAIFQGALPVSEPKGQLAALVAENADIGGPLFLNGARVRGQVRLASARVRGDIEADRACLSYPARAAPAVLAESIEVGDDLFLRGSVVGGTLDLTGARIGGGFVLDGAQLFRTRGLDAHGQDHAALLAVNATIGENAEFRRYQEPGRRTLVFRATGKLDLTGTRIAGDLSFEGSRLANRTANAEGIALMAERSRIEGNLEFAGVREPPAAGAMLWDGAGPGFARRFLAEGEVHLAGASVGRDFRCNGACFANPGRSAIYAKDLVIGDDLQLLHTDAEGDLRFERLSVSGSVKWTGLTVGASGKHGRAAQLDLRHARVGSALKAVRLTLADGARVDLGGMRAAIIQDWTPRGWSIGNLDREAECRINFDGFQYDRIELAPGWPPVRNPMLRAICGIPLQFGPPEHRRADALLDWILHQPRVPGASPEVSFFPQPYRQLARVLRSQGEEEAAIRVAIAERWAASRKGISSWLRWLFGPFFGFGLLRRRATCTLIGYIALGAFGVWLAHASDMLVEATMVTAPAFTVDGSTQAARRVFISAQKSDITLTDIPCTDTAGGLEADLVYAMDMIVPFIPLHQETKCEIKQGLEITPGWLIAKAVYSVIGWVVFSLWLGTFSGLLKRSEEG